MNMKRMTIAALAVAGVLLPSGMIGQMDPNQNPPITTGPQNQNPPGGVQNGNQTPNTMRDSLGAPGMTGQEMADKKFIQDAVMGGLGEIKLGTLAAQKGGTGVKEFGQKMADDHATMNKEWANIADEMGIMMPKKMSKDDQAEYDKLSKLSGDAFDKEYILFVAKAHRQDLHDFRTEAAVASNQELTTEIVNASRIVRDHLTILTKLAADKGVTLPPRPPRPGGTPPAGQ